MTRLRQLQCIDRYYQFSFDNILTHRSPSFRYSFRAMFSCAPNFFILTLCMAIVEIPISFITDISKLAPFNMLANGLIFTSLLTCIGFALFGDNLPDEEVMRSNDKFEGFSNNPSHPMNVFQNLTHLSPFLSKWYLFVGTSRSL